MDDARAPLSPDMLDEAERRALAAAVAEALLDPGPTCRMKKCGQKSKRKSKLLNAG